MVLSFFEGFFLDMGMISMFKFQFTTELSVTKDYMLAIATQ
jgi:hypothetical protein